MSPAWSSTGRASPTTPSGVSRPGAKRGLTFAAAYPGRASFSRAQADEQVLDTIRTALFWSVGEAASNPPQVPFTVGLLAVHDGFALGDDGEGVRQVPMGPSRASAPRPHMHDPVARCRIDAPFDVWAGRAIRFERVGVVLPRRSSMWIGRRSPIGLSIGSPRCEGRWGPVECPEERRGPPVDVVVAHAPPHGPHSSLGLAIAHLDRLEDRPLHLFDVMWVDDECCWRQRCLHTDRRGSVWMGRPRAVSMFTG
jgi:hypothetical protein